MGTYQTSIIVTLGVVVLAGVVGAAFSSVNAAQIIGFCSITCVSLLTLLQAKQTAVQAEISADKSEERLHTITQVALDTKKTGEVVHRLVNSGNLNQLKLYAVMARRMATNTGDVADIEIADQAEKLYQEHAEHQKEVDQKP